MTNKDHLINLPAKIKEMLIQVLLNCILQKSVEHNKDQIMLRKVIPTGIRGISQFRGKYWASVIPPTQTAYFHLNSLLYMQIA